jgi:hypothetical protein
MKCIHQAVKAALGEKILRSKTKPNYYWKKEIGQLVKKKKQTNKQTKNNNNNNLKWIISKDPKDGIELRRMQGKIRKMVAEAKNKSWEKTCSTVESLYTHEGPNLIMKCTFFLCFYKGYFILSGNLFHAFNIVSATISLSASKVSSWQLMHHCSGPC